ncbi:MAG: bifunctional oligoribonuclease/PAP phosphatase NrnA [Bacteroides sp.]|nr:bifunctional oligoribonuclease/PAP phosphatase NrnA [Bacteroides sp.]MCM1414236.1 bifunctional oligoribonuclease/PAP phosphatase NrnA [Bacteroides sp.]MCM1471265.1 bifunctional oligoribonuclease/PAP phosphatase NrnA [Bacteroides sp.]
MSSQIITPDQIQSLKETIDRAKNIAVTCHMGPDGDAMGSSLAMARVLSAMGKSTTVVVPDCPPLNLMFLPGTDSIVIASCRVDKARLVLGDADLIFVLDYNDLKRVDMMAPMIEQSNARRVVIDHHLNPLIEADIVISRPDLSSTCALVWLVLDACGYTHLIDVEAATCLCTGMMTDTGNFSYNSNDPRLYAILANLMATGVDKDAIYNRLFNTNSESRIRIMGYAQYEKMRLFHDRHASLIALSRKDLADLDYHKGDTEALVNVPLSIPGIVYSIFLREDEPGYVKVSMRSKGEFSVKDLCERHFAGGGHKNAAGGEIHLPIDKAVRQVEALIMTTDAESPQELTC